MVDYVWPSHIPVAEVEWRLVDLTSRQDSPYSGSVRTVSRGQRLACTFRLQNLSAADRAYVLGLVAALRGGSNRIWLFDPANRQRGSFPGSELVSNGTFANGSTGWATSNATLSVADRVLRSTKTATTAGGYAIASGATTVTQYAPHLARVLTMAGRGSAVAGDVRLGATAAGTEYAQLGTSGPGLWSSVGVPFTTSAYLGWADYAVGQAGDYHLVSYASMQRCALVDNGLNALTFSDAFDDGSWTKTLGSITTNAAVSFDGGTTADAFTESGTGVHSVSKTATVTSATQDVTCAFVVGQLNRTWAYVQMTEATGSSVVQAYVNLATGALGTVNTGVNWANTRVAIVSLGSNYYAVFVTARKNNAATSVFVQCGPATADNTNSYAAPGNAGILIARGAFAVSAVPMRLIQTTTTAATGTGQSGVAIYVKGLPVSTAGLLLPGDGVEISGERKIVTASLDSDAAGLGYLQFEPAMRVAAADNAPVIIGQPLMKAILAEDAGWSTRPGIFSDLDLAFVEA